MIIKQSLVEGVVEKLGSYYSIDVEFANTLFTVYSDSSKGISEFEARLVAAVALEDGLEDVASESLPVYLDLFTNIVDTRTDLRPLIGGNYGGTWLARYSITAGDETRLYG
jgi:hypothetical protein